MNYHYNYHFLKCHEFVSKLQKALHSFYLRRRNISWFKWVNAAFKNQILPTCIFSYHRRNHNSIFPWPIYLKVIDWNYILKYYLIFTFSLYRRLPASSTFWILPTFQFQSMAQTLALTIIEIQPYEVILGAYFNCRLLILSISDVWTISASRYINIVIQGREVSIQFEDSFNMISNQSMSKPTYLYLSSTSDPLSFCCSLQK